jgi:preprotein translocase subunit SecE
LLAFLWQLRLAWTRSVAKNTRQQRRERRQRSADGTAPAQRAPRARQAQALPAEPAKAEAPRRAGRGGRAFRFIGESWAELKKVEWPSQNQVIQGTVVVLVACLIVGLYLYANDLLWKRVVEAILGQ